MLTSHAIDLATVTVARRPFAVALLGTAWSEPALIGYAHAFEQAADVRRPPSAINPTLFGGTPVS